MAKSNRNPRRALFVQLGFAFVALVVAVFGFSSRLERGSSEAFALDAPPVLPASAASAAPSASASAPAAPASPAPSASADAGAPSDSAAPADVNAIDLAVAPEGGVPRQPSGTEYKSPFAMPNAKGAVPIKMGMLLNSVDDYDVKTGTFSADFFVSLTSQKPMPSIDLHFPNGKVEDKQVLADKPTFKLYRLSGEFKSPANLRDYPFDSQALRIIIEDDTRGTDQVRFQADHDRTKLARGFRSVGWQVSYVEARSISHSYPERFEGDDLYYGRYIFSLGLERYASSAAFKVFVPAFVIVIISLLGMWVPPSEMEVRSNSGAPMLAGAVLFHFSLMQELPATSYLTRADKLMLGVYVSLILGMASTWIMFLVPEEKQDLVFRIARTTVPIATAIVMGLAVVA